MAVDDFISPTDPAKLQLLRATEWLSVYAVAAYLERQIDKPGLGQTIAMGFGSFLMRGGADHLPGAVAARTGLNPESAAALHRRCA